MKDRIREEEEAGFVAMGEPLKEKQQSKNSPAEGKGAPKGKGNGDADETNAKKKGEKGAKVEVELSEEDLALKTNLELLVQRVSDSKSGVAKLALEQMRTEIKTSTRYVFLRSLTSDNLAFFYFFLPVRRPPPSVFTRSERK